MEITLPTDTDRIKVFCGDCIEVMKLLPDNSVDAIVTDPPYGLEFMGKDWDKFKDGKNIAGGTTGISCIKNNYKFIGIEKEPEYIKIAEARLKYATESKPKTEQEVLF